MDLIKQVNPWGGAGGSSAKVQKVRDAQDLLFLFFCCVWAMLHPKEERAFVLCQSIYPEGVRRCAKLDAEQPGYLSRSE